MAVIAFPLPTEAEPRRRTRRTEEDRSLRPVAAPRPAALPVTVLRRRIAWGLVSAAGAVALSVSAFQVLIAQSEFELARLQSDAATAEDRFDRLRLQVAELESPARIMATAQERLGMVPPPGVTYLTPLPAESATPAATSSDVGAETVAGDWSRIKPILSTQP
jgi:cell division protein FtsL